MTSKVPKYKTVKIGQKFGAWTVISACIDRQGPRQIIRLFECRCACGKIHEVNAANLIDGQSTGCQDCGRRKAWLKRPTLLFPGRKIGNLTLIKKLPAKSPTATNADWDCQCACGNTRRLPYSTLRAYIYQDRETYGCHQCAHENGIVRPHREHMLIMYDDWCLTLQQIGDCFGITRERVRQIVNDERGGPK